MASEPAPLPGANTIRSLTDQDSIFKAFDSYPWKKDGSFLSGLHSILGQPSPPPSSSSSRDIATHARIFYYAQRVGVSIDFASYQAWLALHPDHQPPDILTVFAPTADADIFDWQRAAPRAELFVDRTAQDQARLDGAAEPSYPMAFADMIKLIQEGKPVPGIRQIPNTIERDSTVSPVGSRPVPRKPWEKEAPAAETPNPLDLKFPALEEEK